MLIELAGVGPAVTGEGATASVLAQEPPPPPGKGDEFGKASPVGLVVIILLGIVTVALIRSMTRRIRRLPSSFERAGARDRASSDASSGSDGGSGEGSTADTGGSGSDSNSSSGD